MRWQFFQFAAHVLALIVALVGATLGLPLWIILPLALVPILLVFWLEDRAICPAVRRCPRCGATATGPGGACPRCGVHA